MVQMSSFDEHPVGRPRTEDKDDYTTHAFLVHLHSSLFQDLPPMPNTGTRQKRRRTSPHDHAILETAYQRNSKPDKTERAEIVKQVTLGEKEVQIWFQNRRQNDRRRARPLLPHELVPHFRNDVPKEILAHSILSNDRSGPQEASSAVEPGPERPPSVLSLHSHVSIHDLLNPSSSAEERVQSSSEQEQSGPSASQSTPSSTFEHPQVQKTPESGDSEGDIPGNSGRKRRHEEMSDPDFREKDALQPDQAELESKSSLIRLSMSVDGVMKVKTTLEDTPSPPKGRAPPPPSSRASKVLQRSKSAIEDGTLCDSLAVEQSTPPLLRRGIGRSRDPRTWEFYCDSDARGALSSRAEAERTGSAVGAINLIRSQSHKSRKQVLAPQRTKGNSRLGGESQHSEKPKLSRAKSFMGRLQSFEIDVGLKAAKIDSPRLLRSPSGDSDKENWAPGTRHSTNPLRRTQPGTGRRGVLLEESGLQGCSQDRVQDRALHGAYASKRAVEVGKENLNQVGRGLLNKEKDNGEDLDCVQGLLSLSQGAWKCDR